MARFAVGLSLCLLVASVAPSTAQIDQAIVPYTDYATGNIHLSIPIRDKANFKFNLEVNSHLYIGNSTDQVLPGEIFGGTAVYGRSLPAVGVSLTSQYANSSYICPGTTGDVEYTAIDVVMPDGSSHPLPAAFKWDVPVTGTACLPTPASAWTTDDSGLVVVTTQTPWVVYDKSGTKYTLQSTPSYTNTTSVSNTDSDGNITSATLQASQYTGYAHVPYQYTDTYGATADVHHPMTVLYGQGSGNNQIWYEYYDSAGTLQEAIVTTKTAAQLGGYGGSDFNCAAVEDEFTDFEEAAEQFVTSIVLPDGQTYGFQYETQTSGRTGHTLITGRISQITFPGGGTLAYTYSGGNSGLQCTTGVIPTLTVVRNDNNGNSATYTITNNWTTLTNNQGSFTVSVSNSVDNGNSVTHYSGADPNQGEAWKAQHWPFSGLFATETVVNQGSTQLSATIKCYNGGGGSNPLTNCVTNPNPMPAYPITSTYAYSNHDGMASTTTNKVYDTFDSFGLHTAHQVYNWGTWGAGNLLTTTSWTWNGDTSCGSTAGYTMDRQCSVNVTDGGSTNYRNETFSYYSNGDLKTSNVQLTRTPTWLTTTYAGYAHGLPGSAAITGGGTTSFTYGNCGGLALTEVTYPVSTAGNTQQSWLCDGGVVNSVTDQNSNTTSFGFDSMWRLTSTTYPDSSSDVDSSVFTVNGLYGPNLVITKALTTSTLSVETIWYDGFMKPRQMWKLDPNNPGSSVCGFFSAPKSCTNITYDGLGRTFSVSNPFYTALDPTYGLTQYQYDALGRTILVSNPDGGTITTKFSGSDTHVYGLSSLNIYTENDALGRVVASCDGVGEPVTMANGDTTKSCGLTYYSVSGFPSTYKYYPSGDMYSKYFAGSGTTEQKSYSFDVAGRITGLTLPESGSESFTYDSPIPGQVSTHTDARNIVTTYSVDNMYRPTSTTFSDGTPTITNTYDTGGTNVIGRLKSVSTANTITGYNYDVMGRMNYKGEQAPLEFGNRNTTVTYGFDFAGNRTSLADSDSNNTLTYSRNAIGQLTGITASYAGITGDIVPTCIASCEESFSYNALGLPVTASGATFPRTYTYDQMGRLLNMGDTGLAPYTLSIGRDYDGKVTSVNDQILGQWTYGYDNYFSGGRLISATCATGNGTCANGYGATSWTYDEYGNRWTQTAYKGLNTSFTYDTRAGGAMQNHIILSGMTYDAAGDMITDTVPNTYTYDALHRVKTASMNSSTFTYDGLGNRVEDVNASGTTDFYFDGTSILHFNTASSYGLGMKAGFGEYRGAPGAMRYYEDWRDQVGNLRQQMEVMSVSGGSASSEQYAQTFVSLPFGDSYLDTNQNGDEDTDMTSQFLFGDMMQIGGVNFSENRAHNTQIGRWLTPDPAHAGWNAYVYANNNPVTMNDPTGLDPIPFPLNFGGAPGVAGYYGGDFGCTLDGLECGAVLRGGLGLLGDNAIASCPQCRNPFVIVGADNEAYQWHPSTSGSYTRENGTVVLTHTIGGWGKALEHLNNAFAETTTKVTIGIGIGEKWKLGPGDVTLEAATKANVSFSAGKLAISKSVEIAGAAGKWHKKVGLAWSAEQVVGSVDMDTGQISGQELATGESTVGATTKTFGGTANQDRLEFGVEVGDGALGGGSISITREGVGELEDAWQEVMDALGPE